MVITLHRTLNTTPNLPMSGPALIFLVMIISSRKRIDCREAILLLIYMANT